MRLTICVILIFCAISGVYADDSTGYVTAFDCDILYREHLSELADNGIVNYYPYFGTFRQYANVSTRTFVNINAGIYPDYETARNVAEEYFDETAAWYMEGLITGENIGDQVWHTSYDRERPSYIALVRKNVFIHLGIARYDEGVELIKAVDDALVNGSSFVELGDHIDCPQILSVDVLEPPLVINEKEYLKVNAYDPLGNDLYYRMLECNAEKSADGNVFYARVPEAGEETFTAWVVNDKNVFSYKYNITLTFTDPTAVDDEDNSVETPSTFALSQNRPNPFNPSTSIPFTLDEDGRVRLTVYDLLGREVAVLAEGHMSAGAHELTWDGRTGDGVPCASGVYLCRLVTPHGSESRRMTLIR